jgi:hypothetical protein
MCVNKSDCDAKWSAARDWVLHHSKMKINLYSSDLIMTDDPAPDSPYLGYLVRKQSTLQPGGYTIAVNIWCNDVWGCDSAIKAARADFNRFVNSAIAKDASTSAATAQVANHERPTAGVKAGMVNNKVVVKNVTPGSPAEKAGLKINDVILAFDNIPITDTARLSDLIQRVQFGETKQIRIRRGNKILDLSVQYPTLEEIRSNTPQAEGADTEAK